MNGAVFGRYYSGKSILHQLDPRVKLVGMMLYTVLLFFVEKISVLLFAGGILLILIIASGVPFRYIGKSLRGILVLLLCSAICNVLFTKGEVIWKWSIVSITHEGIYNGIFVSLRLIFLLFASALLTLTTTTGALTDGLEQGLGFLSKIKIPMRDMIMMVTIALRFIPILVEEAEKIIKAQTARGADFNDRNWIKRGLAMVPVLVPLFTSAMRRGTELADAMDARCYGAKKSRTKLYPLHYTKKDYIAYGMILGYSIVVLGVGMS